MNQPPIFGVLTRHSRDLEKVRRRESERVLTRHSRCLGRKQGRYTVKTTIMMRFCPAVNRRVSHLRSC